MNKEMIWMMVGALALLVVASIAGFVMARRASPGKKVGVANFNARTKSWWVMVGIFAITLYLGHWTTVVLFCLISFLALREFITLDETRYMNPKPFLILVAFIAPFTAQAELTMPHIFGDHMVL